MMPPDSIDIDKQVSTRRRQTIEDIEPETGPFQEMLPSYNNLEWPPIKEYLDKKFKSQNWTEYKQIFVGSRDLDSIRVDTHAHLL
jgi:hypothetical protein